MRWFIALTLVLGACSTAEEAPCGGDEDCLGGACVAGSCQVSPDAPSPADGAADAAPSVVTDAAPDLAVDAASAPCEPGRQREARCGVDAYQAQRCVAEVWQPDGPCLGVPPTPCGRVCDGCGPRPRDGVVDQRYAYRLADVPTQEAGPFRAYTRLECDGCGDFRDGVVDLRRVRQFDPDGRLTRSRCDGCQQTLDGQDDEQRLYTWGEDEVEIRTVRLPDELLVDVQRVTLDPSGRVLRAATSRPGAPEPHVVETHHYDALGRLTHRVAVDAEGFELARATVERDARGWAVGETHEAEGVIVKRFAEDLGCWICDGPTCTQGAPAGCLHLPGTVPSAYACVGPACPQGLELARPIDPSEARWLLRALPDPEDLAVNARRGQGNFAWADGSPVDAIWWADGQPAAGDCARLGPDGELRTNACDATFQRLCRRPE